MIILFFFNDKKIAGRDLSWHGLKISRIAVHIDMADGSEHLIHIDSPKLVSLRLGWISNYEKWIKLNKSILALRASGEWSPNLENLGESNHFSKNLKVPSVLQAKIGLDFYRKIIVGIQTELRKLYGDISSGQVITSLRFAIPIISKN